MKTKNHSGFKKWRKKVFIEVGKYPQLKRLEDFINYSFLNSCYYDGLTPEDCVNTLLSS